MSREKGFIEKVKEENIVNKWYIDIDNFKAINDALGKMEQKAQNIIILSEKKVQGAQNFPVIETMQVDPLLDIASFDALIFTSKNGVKYLDEFTSKWRTIPAYAIAPQTAQVIEKRGGSLQFTSAKKHGDQFADELIPLLKGKKCAFIGAQKVVSNLVDILNTQNIDCQHIVVYKTQCKKNIDQIKLPHDAIIVFSSPSTVECFFKNIKWEKSFQAISIGETTAKYFPKDIEVIVSDDTSLDSCVQKALSL